MSSFLAASLAGLAAGVLGAMGLGGGAVLLLWLALSGVEQLAAQGINLTFFLPVAALSLILHRKNGLVRFAAALPMAAGGVAGLAAGVALAERLPGSALSKAFALLCGLIALREARDALRLLREKGPGLLHKPPKSGKNSL